LLELKVLSCQVIIVYTKHSHSCVTTFAQVTMVITQARTWGKREISHHFFLIQIVYYSSNKCLLKQLRAGAFEKSFEAWWLVEQVI